MEIQISTSESYCWHCIILGELYASHDEQFAGSHIKSLETMTEEGNCLLLQVEFQLQI